MESDEKQPRGRPWAMTPEAAEEIIYRLSAGEPLEAICRSPGMPSVSSVHRWKAENKDFAGQFARARAIGFDAIAADALAIADDSSGDVIETERGPKMDAEFVARSRLRVETRLKLLAKWCPEKYGEKLDVTGIPAGQSVNIMLPVRERLKRLKRAGADEIADGGGSIQSAGAEESEAPK